MSVSFDLETRIAAPPGDVFRVSLDVDAHLASMEESGEEAVAGVTSGVMELGDTVTWRARHFGVTWTMTSVISAMDPPRRFVDEQHRGPFKEYWHEHIFEPDGGGTLMYDHIRFTAPFGPLGRLAEKLALGAYLPRLIIERNAHIRSELEGS